MPKFYVTSSAEDSIIGCEYSKAKAIKLATDLYGRRAGKVATVDCITIEMPMREAVRLLLGSKGGYAADITTVWPTGAN